MASFGINKQAVVLEIDLELRSFEQTFTANLNDSYVSTFLNISSIANRLKKAEIVNIIWIYMNQG